MTKEKNVSEEAHQIHKKLNRFFVIIPRHHLYYLSQVSYLMIMHLVLPRRLHLLGDMKPVGAVQRAKWAEHHLAWVELRRGVRRRAAATHRVVLEGAVVQVGVFEPRTVRGY